MSFRLNLRDWESNRAMVAEAMQALLVRFPEDPALQIVLNGLYAQQLMIDNLANQLKVIMEQSKLSRGAEDGTKRLIMEKNTFAGRVGGE